jgi:hypothetical protein
VIFIDRSIPRPVANALQAVRSDVLWLEDRFPHGARDSDWLEAAGRNDWLVISRDKKIRTRPGERRQIIANRVGCFCLVQKQPLTRWDYLKLIVLTLDEMERLFFETERPFIFGVGRTGLIRPLYLKGT